jgi:hypothetical protein
MSKRQLSPGERECAHPGCSFVLPRPRVPGRPPTRCVEHRRLRPHTKARRKAPPLRVVREQDLVDDDLGAAPVPQPPDATTGGLATVVRADLDALFSGHPAARSLAALAVSYAELFDHPLTRADPRAAAALGREIRETLRALVDHEEAEDDDDLGSVPPPVVIPSA